MYTSIVTHNDFDGIASAALCVRAFSINKIFFTGPNAISKAQTRVLNTDIVCDLPYPLECAMWFDHHEGNTQELSYRNIDFKTLPGKFSPEPSCARVIWNYIKEKNLMVPDFLENMVIAADIIDSFNYKNVEEWRKETPYHIIDKAIKADKPIYASNAFLKRTALLLAHYPIIDVAEDEEIYAEYEKYKKEETEMLYVIAQNSYYLPEDSEKELIIIDLTNLSRKSIVTKNLAMIQYPEALGILLIQNQFMDGAKTTNLSFSLSLSIKTNNMPNNKHCGKIMQHLNAGDGHAGAAGGTMKCSTKDEMVKTKKELLVKILRMFKEQ